MRYVRRAVPKKALALGFSITGSPAIGAMAAGMGSTVTPSASPEVVPPKCASPAQSGLTNATVESLTDGVLLLNFADQHVAINTSGDTAVTRPEPVPASEVREGARIAAGGAMGQDGTLQAVVVWISSR